MGYKKLKTIISNVGTTHPSLQEHIRYRHRKVLSEDGRSYLTQRYPKVIPMPRMVEDFFRHFSVIDIHDHLRQGTLQFHAHWRTLTWWHRLFSTILGIIVVDAYNAYKFEFRRMHGRATNSMDFPTFVHQLDW